MLRSDKQNLSRLEFLSALVDKPWEPRITVKDKVQELHDQAKPWALEQLQVALKTLRKPTVAECSVLLRAARVYGGINFLQERCDLLVIIYLRLIDVGRLAVYYLSLSLLRTSSSSISLQARSSSTKNTPSAKTRHTSCLPSSPLPSPKQSSINQSRLPLTRTPTDIIDLRPPRTSRTRPLRPMFEYAFSSAVHSL